MAVKSVTQRKDYSHFCRKTRVKAHIPTLRTLAGPTPTNISRNSEPLTVMKGTLASPAVALAKSVFPVPGGPVKIAPYQQGKYRRVKAFIKRSPINLNWH